MTKRLTFLFLLCFAVVASIIFMFSKNYEVLTWDDAGPLTQSDFQNIRTGELRKFTGIITKRPYETDQDVLMLKVADDKHTVGVTLFPNMGVITDQYKLGDEIQVIGLVDQYKQQLQLKPLSKRSIRILKANTNRHWALYPEVNLSEINKYLGQTVIVDPVVFLDVRQIKTNSGQHIVFEAYDGKMKVSSVSFNGNWTQETLEVMKSGRQLKVYADIDTYEGNPSLVVNDVIESQKDSRIDVSGVEIVVALGKAGKFIGETINIGPVEASRVESFISKSGLQHIRMSVSQNHIKTSAIMYSGVWTENDRHLLESGKKVILRAKVETFNNDLSLVIESVKASEES